MIPGAVSGSGARGQAQRNEWTVVPERGKPRSPKLKGGSEWYAAFSAELQDAVNAVKTSVEPEALSGTLARDALKLCFAEAKSITDGKMIRIR